MSFTGVADAEQLTVLKLALEAHCLSRGISGKREREDAAGLVMSLFMSGTSKLDELLAALADASDRNERYQRRG